MRDNWFEVDKRGLAKVLARKGVEFAIGELVQNAWDAEGVSRVSVSLRAAPRGRNAELVVEDDSPAGFADLRHSYRLFGGSAKGGDPEKRGKFDLGEKLVFALAKSAEVSTTTGTVLFEPSGRRVDRKLKRERGSRVEARLPMTRADLERCERFVARLIPPEGIRTEFNGVPLPSRRPVGIARATLETEIADDAGKLRRLYRTCDIRIHRPQPGERGTLYEMGLPVQETGDAYHYDIQQRVPVGFDRDAVSAYYLNTVRSAVLNIAVVIDEIDQPAAEWIDRALETNATPETLKRIIARRFGKKAVAADPTDQEAVCKAVAEGYTVVHDGSLTGAIWERVRQADALPRAGRIFPSRPSKEGAADEIPEEEWTPGMKRVARYVRQLGEKLLGFEPLVRIVNHLKGGYVAVWSDGTLTFNAGKLPQSFWPPNYINDEVVELVIHEFGHHYETNHLSSGYADALCKLAAKLRHHGSLDWS